MQQEQITRLIDRFIPMRQRHEAYKRTDILIKLRTIVTVLILSLLLPFLALCIFSILHFVTGLDLSLALLSTAGILLILVFQHLIFQSYGDIYLTAAAYSVNFFLSTVAAVYFTGGWHSPCMLLMFCAPIMTFLITTSASAIVMLWITLFTGLFFFALQQQAVVTPQLIPEENTGYIQACIWIMSTIILFVFLYTLFGYLM